MFFICVIISLMFCSCQQPQVQLLSSDGQLVAIVGDEELRSGDIAKAIPYNLVGEDSVRFVNLYVDRWVKHQIKVREAERIFSSSFAEIDDMVENYRSSLLTQKLNQYYINTVNEMPFTAEDVRSYYEKNRQHFKLNRPIVKGAILRMPANSNSRTAITTMMKSRSKDTRTNLISMCDKSLDMNFEEFTTWVDFSDFMAQLPVVKGDDNLYLTRRGVQSLKDDKHIYLFEVEEYRKSGETSPLEDVEDQIRRLLTKQFHNEVVRSREESLFESAMSSEDVKLYMELN